MLPTRSGLQPHRAIPVLSHPMRGIIHAAGMARARDQSGSSLLKFPITLTPPTDASPLLPCRHTDHNR